MSLKKLDKQPGRSSGLLNTIIVSKKHDKSLMADLYRSYQWWKAEEEVEQHVSGKVVKNIENFFIAPSRLVNKDVRLFDTVWWLGCISAGLALLIVNGFSPILNLYVDGRDTLPMPMIVNFVLWWSGVLVSFAISLSLLHSSFKITQKYFINNWCLNERSRDRRNLFMVLSILFSYVLVVIYLIILITTIVQIKIKRAKEFEDRLRGKS